jgi:hypothetical protein
VKSAAFKEAPPTNPPSTLGHANNSRSVPHLDANIRALPAACCRGISEAVARLGTKELPAPAYESLVLWWFCRVHGLIPCSDADFQNALRWAAEI